MRNRQYTAKQIIYILREECEARGRRITQKDLRSSDWDGPPEHQIRKYFGGITNAMNIVNYRTPEEKEADLKKAIAEAAARIVALG